MGLRDILRKKDSLDDGEPANRETMDSLNAPEFKLVRTDTHSQETVHPPAHGSASGFNSPLSDGPGGGYLSVNDGASPPSKNRRSMDNIFSSSRSRSASVSSTASASGRSKFRLSQRLGLSRAPSSSEHVPQNLPAIAVDAPDGGALSPHQQPQAAGGAGQGPPAVGTSKGAPVSAQEDQWEQRATMLASTTERARSKSISAGGGGDGSSSLGVGGPAGGRGRAASVGGPVSSQAIDADIQEAIRLHEAGDLEKSTRMFGRLADPQGANNPLSQVLYGLALRHGWGCKPDVTSAVTYLTSAASNAAAIEQLALQAGLKKGGAAKGELVLAIFELGNSFRYGWGTDKDPFAAKQYYETAANLGDTDAMNETAWCYLEGFGCKKDKFTSARYYRLAETNGNKTLGNTWIWKEKYDPDAGGKKKKK